MKFLIEGLDRLGKDTLIEQIQNRLGFHQVIHYSKPIVLDQCLSVTGNKHEALSLYQAQSFDCMFRMLELDVPLIMNRAHLGECVYAPLYRNYSGDYVFIMEDVYEVENNNDVRLILLTENFSISKHFNDDGESFDISKRELEQNLFLEAFEKSRIKDKRIVCVTDTDGGFKDSLLILDEAIR